MRILSILLTIVLPGAGHLLRRKYLRGVGLLFCLGVCVDGMFFAWIRLGETSGERYMYGFIALGAILWLYALADIIRLARVDREAAQQRKDEHLRQGLIHYLRDELDQAIAEFRAVLKLDSDDADARFHLAKAYRVAGQLDKASRALRRCRACDEEDKWAAEIDREFGKIRAQKHG